MASTCHALVSPLLTKEAADIMTCANRVEGRPSDGAHVLSELRAVYASLDKYPVVTIVTEIIKLKVKPTVTGVINVVSQLNAYNERLRAISPASIFTVQSKGFADEGVSEELLRCTFEELYAGLWARLPKEWSSENYVLELDHELPIDMFDFSDPVQVRACWHFSNTRWMPARRSLK